MLSEKDFERLWFPYKTEGEPNGVSINSFCIGNNIPYTAFYDWFKKTQKKSRQLDEMIARLDEIGKDLKESNRKIDSLTNTLLKANSKVEKAAIEYKLRDKEYKKLEKKYNALLERLSTAE